MRRRAVDLVAVVVNAPAGLDAARLGWVELGAARAVDLVGRGGRGPAALARRFAST